MPPVESAKSTSANPIVVDLGRRSRKAVKRLRRGKGKVMDQVNQVIQDLRTTNKISASAQPVIIVVRERPDFFIDW